jgi:ABC-type bacteriocin/lantibiotic exporter with double-glycine peptidase domain
MEIRQGQAGFQKVDFAYDPRLSTLKDVDTWIQRGTGELIGSGKTTVLRLPPGSTT